MSNLTSLPPVRVRKRPQPHRQSAYSSIESTGHSISKSGTAPKKRQPNSGSFKKGEPSRNPNGRPKGAKGYKAVVRKILMEPVLVRLPTGPKKITVFEAVVLKERDLAFAGDRFARKTLLELGCRVLSEEALEDTGLQPVTDSEADRAIIDWFEEEVRQKTPKGEGGGK